MSFSPEGLVHLRRQPEGKGYRETVIFGLGQGEQSPSEETEEPESFRLSTRISWTFLKMSCTQSRGV